MRRAGRRTRTALLAARLALVLSPLALVACAETGPVVRIADGRTIQGRFIAPDAYRSFMLGALSEETGEPRGALAAYEASARLDGDAPEVWTRIARIHCELPGDEAAARTALAQALDRDPAYEPALDLKVSCAFMATTAGGRAARPDDTFGVSRLGAREMGKPPVSEAERRRLEALTLLHAEAPGAWEALATWGAAHGDVALTLRGLEGVARTAPLRHFALGGWVASLAGDGHLSAARELAGALLDADARESPWGGAKSPVKRPLVASLAIDAAILAHDLPRIQTRCARAHVGLESAAARAWAMGDVRLAAEIVMPVVKSDPDNFVAHLVKEGAEGRAAPHLLVGRDKEAPLPPEVALPLARDLLASDGPLAARAALKLGGGAHLSGGDALLTPIMVDLVIAGALDDTSVPADARIELAARRGMVPSEADVAAPDLDARHKLLGAALRGVASESVLAEARRLASAGDDDTIVAVSLARLALAHSGTLGVDARHCLEASALTDPLAAAALLDLALRTGAPADLSVARKHLAPLAKTTAERARVVE